MRTSILLLSLFGVAACAVSDPDSSGDDLIPPDGLLEAGVWGGELRRLDIAADGSATLSGGCAYATLEAATVSGGAFDWDLAWTDELAYVDTGDHSYPVGLTGTISGDRLEGTLRFDENTQDLVLTRGVPTDISHCD